MLPRENCVEAPNPYLCMGVCTGGFPKCDVRLSGGAYKDEGFEAPAKLAAK